MSLRRDEEAVLLRVYIGEADTYRGKPLYRHILEFLKGEGIAGATVLRGIEGFGRTSAISTTSILRLSTDLPIVIEVADTEENIRRVKTELAMIIKEGLITEERVQIVFFGGVDKGLEKEKAASGDSRNL